MIDTTLRLPAQVGPENVTVRLLHRAETVVIEGKSYGIKDRIGDEPTA